MTTGLPADLADLTARYAPPAGRHVRGGMVLSADGGTSHGDTSGALSTPTDQAVFQVLRSHADVVLVGAGTARAEGYGPVELPAEHRARRIAEGRPADPPLALVTHSLNVPAKALPGAIVIAVGADGTADLPDVIAVPDLRTALDGLAERGLTRVLCEGGPRLLGDLLAAGLLDELCTTVSPRLVGRSAGIIGVDLAAPVDLTLEHLLEHDGTLLLRWRVG